MAIRGADSQLASMAELDYAQDLKSCEQTNALVGSTPTAGIKRLLGEEVMTDIFEKGCLCNLDCGVWGARVKIPKEKILLDADKNFWSAAMRLVDPKTLKDIEAIRNEARMFLVNNSLTFPIRGTTFVPKDKIEKIENGLREFAEKFRTAVDAFIKDYTTFREEAREHLGELYDESRYPPDISRKFGFSWQFYAIGMGNGAKILSPELYAREKQKLEDQLREFSESAVMTLRLKFFEMLDNIVKKLAGAHHIAKESLLVKPQEFIEDFKALNICDDAEMARMTEKVGAILDGVNIDSIKSDELFARRIATQVAEVEIELAKVIKDSPSRMLDIDWDEEEKK